MKKKITFVGVISSLTLTLVLLTGCSDKIEPGNRAKEHPLFDQPVRVEKARVIEWQSTYRAKVIVEVPALEGPPLAGEISTVVPGADPRSRTFLVKIDLPPIQGLNSGMYAVALIPSVPRQNILIPKQALLRYGQLTGVFVLDKENIVHFRLLRLGREVGERVEVLSGLKEGDVFVKEPPPALVCPWQWSDSMWERMKKNPSPFLSG